MTNIKALADKVEALEGPTVVTDAMIHIPECRGCDGSLFEFCGNTVSWVTPDGREQAWSGHLPAYTASLDAAMTLAGDGLDDFWASLDPHGEGQWTVGVRIKGKTGCADGNTLEIAFVAACLRAKGDEGC